MAFLDPILNPIFDPLLNQSPFLGILILAFIISLLISVAYKYLTDQELMKSLKDKQKDFQKRMKELRDQPERMMSLQKEAMKTNMEYMKHSFKPTLVTMLPIILIFGWMAANLAHEPIFPGETYSITATFVEDVIGNAELVLDEGSSVISGSSTMEEIKNGQASWKLKSDEGSHILQVQVGEDVESKKVLITEDLDYEEAIEIYSHSDIKSIQINYNKLKPLGDMSIFGWKPGWLGLYIIFSIIFSIAIRKILKLH